MAVAAATVAVKYCKIIIYYLYSYNVRRWQQWQRQRCPRRWDVGNGGGGSGDVCGGAAAAVAVAAT